ncbi:TPA: hypothetical protein HA270_05485, partial [Candidatus Woesearchaeota archaeon]|nr:hypothetical protein [Candidatus Woesearchaeota archaeon]
NKRNGLEYKPKLILPILGINLGILLLAWILPNIFQAIKKDLDHFYFYVIIIWFVLVAVNMLVGLILAYIKKMDFAAAFILSSIITAFLGLVRLNEFGLLRIIIGPAIAIFLVWIFYPHNALREK